MTGFGSADGAVVDGRVRVEIRTVNHRYFNPQFKLPSELAGVEGQLRDRLRQLLERGHIVVSVRWLEPPSSESAIAVDLARARQVVAAAKELKKQLKLKGEVDLAFVARQPDVITRQADGGSGGSAPGGDGAAGRSGPAGCEHGPGRGGGGGKRPGGGRRGGLERPRADRGTGGAGGTGDAGARGAGACHRAAPAPGRARI